MIYGDNPVELTSGAYAPSIAAIVQSGNRYPYAMNNPVKYTDENGEIVHWAVGAAAGATTSLLSNLAKQYVDYKIHDEDFSLGELVSNVAGGTINGALAASGARILITALVSGSTEIVAQAAENSWDYSQVEFGDVLSSVAFSIIGSSGADWIVGKVNTKHLTSMGDGALHRVIQSIGTKNSFGDELLSALKYYTSQAKDESIKLAKSIAVSSGPSWGSLCYDIHNSEMRR